MMKEKIDKYIELTKPKVTLLNLLVGVTCFVLAAFPSVDLLKLAVFAFAGYLACGGCGVLNCVYDQDTDKLMQRTSKRAIPSGSIAPSKALLFGVFLTSGGIAISYFFFNELTAIMMTVGAAFYLIVYTVLLKRKSSWNVIIGGLAGCFAALSGWTAVANTVSLMPLLVSAVDFLWTPGHLWGLAIKKAKEYEKARIPMLPVTVGVKKAAEITVLFNIATIIFSMILAILGLTGILYAAVAVSAGVWFTLESRKLLVFPSEAQGFKIFLASMPYLSVLMAGLLLDKLFFVGL